MPPKGRVVVDEKYCKACGICVKDCPQGVLQLAPDHINTKGYHPAELKAAGCTGCGICTIVCPEAAITVYRDLNKPAQG